LNREVVYKTLREHGVRVPEYIVVDYSEDVHIDEERTQLKINGRVLEKPFVEKPLDAENHEIFIYHRDGSVTELFRKCVVDGVPRNARIRSEGQIRRQGRFLYQTFIDTGGVDIKAYSVGTEYVHCESRKAPVVDGTVDLGEDGQERRVSLQPTMDERDLVRRTVKAFGQNVCGIDILRTELKSYVIDVNGWSFVKRNPKYTREAGRILYKMIVR